VNDAASNNALASFLRQWMKADKTNAPLYKQLSAGVTAAIENGCLQEASHMPSERNLAQSLGVSRITVRTSFEDLAENGLIVRRRGSKSAITRRIEKQITRLASFSESMVRRGMKPDMELLNREIVQPNSKVVMALGIPPDEEVVVLDRLRLADGKPIAIERAIIPRLFLPDTNLLNGSLYQTLEKRGFRPCRGVQRIFAKPMSEEHCQLLKGNPGAASLVIERKCFLGDGRVVEFTETEYNGALFDFVTEISE
jgi:GntR family transcriptional regulator